MKAVWRFFSWLFGCSSLILVAGLASCARPPAENPAATTASVTVSYPVEKSVTDFVEFTGRTAERRCLRAA